LRIVTWLGTILATRTLIEIRFSDIANLSTNREHGVIMNAFLNMTTDILDRFRATDAPDQRWIIANQIAAEMGGTALLAAEFKDAGTDPLWIMSTMDDGWMSDYMAEELYEIDPFITHLNTSLDPIFWQAGSRVPGDKGKTGMDVFYDGLSEKYQSTIGSPFLSGTTGNRKILTFASDHDLNGLGIGDAAEPERQQKMKILLSLIAAHVGVAVPSSGNLYTPDTVQLSPREIEILQLLAQGLMNARIAEKLGIAEITVRKHTISARLKLGASTREQALSIAILNDLITP